MRITATATRTTGTPIATRPTAARTPALMNAPPDPLRRTTHPRPSGVRRSGEAELCRHADAMDHRSRRRRRRPGRRVRLRCVGCLGHDCRDHDHWDWEHGDRDHGEHCRRATIAWILIIGTTSAATAVAGVAVVSGRCVASCSDARQASDATGEQGPATADPAPHLVRDGRGDGRPVHVGCPLGDGLSGSPRERVLRTDRRPVPEARGRSAAGFFAVPFRRAGVLSVSSARPRVDEALFPRTSEQQTTVRRSIGRRPYPWPGCAPKTRVNPCSLSKPCGQSSPPDPVSHLRNNCPGVARVAALRHGHFPARSVRRRILPVTVLGSSSTITTCRGYL